MNSLLNRGTIAAAAVVLSACAAGPIKDPAADRVRADLNALRSNPNLATKAPVALAAAEAAVVEAEKPETDSALTAHRVYVADRKVQTAKALSQAQYADDQRKALSDQGDKVRLDARTREADAAKGAVIIAKSETDAAKAKNDALLAELAALKAKQTDRGVQLTLGDVLFSTGRAELAAGAAFNLDKLVAALGTVAERNIIIDGFTDSVGGDDYNLLLSQRRATAVEQYLTSHGVSATRITATGKGESFPVAGNDNAAGRQLNRRVEVTIANPPQ